ncbi:MAG: efflux RND transporter periplasmic adaptor subunit [Oleiphilaceae bacterium]|nr:efflux RND transporter periplasmic adaptor subunit [Oleiphilaceae bacterium]
MKRSSTIALAMAVVATIWVLSGSLSSNSDQGVAQAKTTEPALFKVRTEPSQAQIIPRQITLQGEADAARLVTLRAETHGAIAALGKTKGERIKAGELIAQIAANDRPARLEKARATLALRQADLKAGNQLRERNLLSDLQHQQNKAAVVAAEAEVKAIEIELAQTSISAPFSGLLSARHVEIGDHVSVGDPIATLVDDSAVLIKAQVPQQHIGTVAIGQTVDATLLDGTTLQGRITYLANQSDSQTRTFAMEAQADNTRALRHFGQSARITINLGEVSAHHLPASVLDLDDKGQLQVKTVGDDQHVQTYGVKLLRNDKDGIWVSGLPEQANVITVGQGFVRAGEKVATVAETDSGEQP